MSRMPVLTREEMDDEQKRVHDAVLKTTGRVGKGPAVGFAYSPGLWEHHDKYSAVAANSSLSQKQVRITAVVAARHLNAAYPWAAQARQALDAGVDRAAVDAINAGETPRFDDAEDEAVYKVASELVRTGTLDDAGFKAAEAALGFRRMADVVGVIGHFCTTAMMANVAGAEAPDDASSRIKA